jgi:hypothetical protein
MTVTLALVESLVLLRFLKHGIGNVLLVPILIDLGAADVGVKTHFESDLI